MCNEKKKNNILENNLFWYKKLSQKITQANRANTLKDFHMPGRMDLSII